MFQPSGKPKPDDAINIQLSLENGHIGLDWLLIGQSNIRDKERFAHLARSVGFEMQEREKNGVSYLRVEEGGNLPQLCEKVICNMYGKSPNTKLDLVVEGFSWQ